MYVLSCSSVGQKSCPGLRCVHCSDFHQAELQVESVRGSSLSRGRLQFLATNPLNANRKTSPGAPNLPDFLTHF